MMKTTTTHMNKEIINEHITNPMEKSHHIQRLSPAARIHVRSLGHVARLGLDLQRDHVQYHRNWKSIHRLRR